MRSVGLLLLRMAVGVIFITHGLPKLLPLWGGSPRETAALFETVGIVPAYPIAIGTGIVELFAGALLVAGAYTASVTILLAVMTVTMGWKVHLSGFSLNQVVEPGTALAIELDLLLLVTLVCLFLSRPRLLSVDAYRRQTAETEAMGRARLRARKN